MKIQIMGSEVLAHEYFDYLHDVEKDDIEKNVKNKKSLIVGVFNEDELKIFSVIDLEKNDIHVREVAGNSVAKQIENWTKVYGIEKTTKFVFGLRVFSYKGQETKRPSRLKLKKNKPK